MANNRGVLKRLRIKKEAGDNGHAAMDDGEVARVAYELYERRGREDGHDLEDWVKAEELVRQRQRAQHAEAPDDRP